MPLSAVNLNELGCPCLKRFTQHPRNFIWSKKRSERPDTLQDLSLALEAERVGRGPVDRLDLESRDGVGHLTDKSEEEDT